MAGGTGSNGRSAEPAGVLGAATGGPGGQMRTALLRIATAGSVDDGKSTLIGRLLFDSKAIFDDQLEAVERTSVERGDGYVNLALLTDGLRAEREQGITIDVAYRYFATPRRRFIIADTPGHVRYTRNMVTGASNADLAIVLIDARSGVVEQSKRHAFLASLLGVPHLAVCVNKMDLVDYDLGVFERIVEDFSSFAAKLELHDLTFIPMSALHGDNVVDRSEAMPWYEGPPLLYHLETVHVASDRNLIDARFPVQRVIRPMTDEHHDYRGYAGRVAGGVIRPGDEVVVMPSGALTEIAAIDTFDGPRDEAFPPMSVTLRLTDDLDVSRGDMICRRNNRPTVDTDIEAYLCWMAEHPLAEGDRFVIKHTTRSVRASVETLRYRIDVEALHRDQSAESLGLNDIGRVALRTTSPLTFDEYRRNRETGSFIVIDEVTNETVGAGMILGATRPERGPVAAGAAQATSPDVVWQSGRVTPEQRSRALGHPGAVVWLTGLPASGKSTLAAEVEQRLVLDRRAAYLLDGDNLRHGLNGDLGFSPDARAENVRRIAHVAALFADAGTVALVALVSPYRADREQARRIVEEAGAEFIEVFVDTPLEECQRRDPKELYARARRGEIPNLTGVGAPYEAPDSPELLIRFGEQSLEDAVGSVLAVLPSLG